MKKFWSVAAVLLGISVMVFLLTDIVEAQVNPRFDTFIGIFCGEQFSRVEIIDRNTKKVIKKFNVRELGSRESFNEVFIEWIKEHYKVGDENNVTFNSMAIRDPSCTSS